MANYDVQVFNFAEEGGVQEEEQHFDEGSQNLVVVLASLVAVQRDPLAYVVVYHSDELTLVLFCQLQRHLL